MTVVAGRRTVERMSERGRYEAEGHVTVRRAVDAVTLRRSLAHLDALVRAPSAGRLICPPLDADTTAAALAGETPLAGLASRLLDGPVQPFGFTYITKEPRTGPPALWHQDGHPWRTQLGVTEAVTLFVALDPATPLSGGLRVIPGSHRRQAAPLRENSTEANLFGRETDPRAVEAALAEADPVDVVLEPGDVSAHHPGLLHCSGPNRSARPRRALIVRYRPAP